MYTGIFLNLSRNEKRRAALTRHLADVGASSRYQRVEAVDGRAVAHAYNTTLDPGNLGLWLSHEYLSHTYNAPGFHLHIIEDDVVFARNAVKVLEGVLQHADAQLGPWDLLFTDIFVPISLDIFRLFSQKMQVYAQSRSYSLVDLATIGFACTSSVLINKSSVAKYASLISGKWALGMPIDLYLRRLVHQRQLKAYVVVPFPTSISRESIDSVLPT
jgi:hypothetical protein